MTKTESVLITSELRKINSDIEQIKARVTELTQDIQGSATLYGRKSKIKGPAKDKDKDAVKVHGSGATTGEKAAQVGAD